MLISISPANSQQVYGPPTPPMYTSPYSGNQMTQDDLRFIMTQRLGNYAANQFSKNRSEAYDSRYNVVLRKLYPATTYFPGYTNQIYSNSLIDNLLRKIRY